MATPLKIKVKVSCSSCKKEWLKRKDGLKRWSGFCSSCSASKSLLGNTHTKGHKLSDEHKKKCSLSLKGKKMPLRTKEWRVNQSKKITGFKHTLEARKKMGDSHRGSKSSTWKGGVTSHNDIVRKSLEIKLWKKACLERDKSTCQKCKHVGGELCVHHINNFADFPELRSSIENGITLCKEDHLTFHSIYGKKNNTLIQLQNFLNIK